MVCLHRNWARGAHVHAKPGSTSGPSASSSLCPADATGFSRKVAVSSSKKLYRRKRCPREIIQSLSETKSKRRMIIYSLSLGVVTISIWYVSNRIFSSVHTNRNVPFEGIF